MLYCREQQLQERRRSEGDLSTLVSGQCRGPAPTEAVLSSSLHADTGQHTGSSRYYSFLPSCLPDSKTLIITLLCCLFTVLGQGGIQAFSHLFSYISVSAVETVERVRLVGTGRGLAAGDGDSSAYLPPPVHCTPHTCHLQEWHMVTTGGTLSELVPILN